MNYFSKRSVELKKNIKVENNIWTIVLDGIVSESNWQEKIIEIKLIWPSGGTSVLYFILLNFLEKLSRYNINKDVLFVLVSEDMDDKMIANIKNEFIKVRRSFKSSNRVNIEWIFFKFKDNKIHLVNTWF